LHQANVRVIPTTIDTSWYVPHPDRWEREGSLCIGWSGSTTTVAHLRTIEAVLRDVQRDRGVRLRVIADQPVTIEGAEVEFVSWTDEREVADLHPIDIGIMPLPDDEWSKGKCGAKALQYMALEIPTVMSPVGVNVDIASGGAALLATSPEEWRDALDRLLDDATLRRRLGSAGRQRVVDRYSVVANAPAYVDAVRSVVDGQRARSSR
jgi:glycosyltransferase involved in cell wall biosynthesis